MTGIINIFAAVGIYYHLRHLNFFFKMLFYNGEKYGIM